MSTDVQGNVQEIALEAKVIRRDGSVEDLGTVAYWHKKRWRRWVAWLTGKGRGGTIKRKRVA